MSAFSASVGMASLILRQHIGRDMTLNQGKKLPDRTQEITAEKIQKAYERGFTIGLKASGQAAFYKDEERTNACIAGRVAGQQERLKVRKAKIIRK